MKALKALYDFIFDYRLTLLGSGALLIIALAKGKQHDWYGFAVHLAAAVAGIYIAWPKLAVRT